MDLYIVNSRHKGAKTPDTEKLHGLRWGLDNTSMLAVDPNSKCRLLQRTIEHRISSYIIENLEDNRPGVENCLPGPLRDCAVRPLGTKMERYHEHRSIGQWFISGDESLKCLNKTLLIYLLKHGYVSSERIRHGPQEKAAWLSFFQKCYTYYSQCITVADKKQHMR